MFAIRNNLTCLGRGGGRGGGGRNKPTRQPTTRPFNIDEAAYEGNVGDEIDLSFGLYGFAGDDYSGLEAFYGASYGSDKVFTFLFF